MEISSLTSSPMAYAQPVTQQAVQGQGLSPFHAMAAGKSMEEASKDFESLFMAQMLQPMFSTIDVDDTFGGGHAEEVMRSLLVQEYGKAMTTNTHSPLRQAIYRDLQLKQDRRAASSPAEARRSPKTERSGKSSSSMDILS